MRQGTCVKVWSSHIKLSNLCSEGNSHEFPSDSEVGEATRHQTYASGKEIIGRVKGGVLCHLGYVQMEDVATHLNEHM